MAKNSVPDWSETAGDNTDIANINIDEGCAPSDINNAIRTMMAQLKAFFKSTVALVNEGSFTPTGTAGENCVAVIPALNYYYRFGNRVTCWGLVTSDPSLAGTSTIFSLSLPIPSDFANAGELAGIFDSSSEHGRILADTVNNLASFTYVSSGSGPTNFAFHFSYIVVS